MRRPVKTLRAVDGVSLSVARGETLGVVGESGCGKSTLARCLVRLYEPDAGSVRFGGRDALALSGDDRRAYNRRVQMVFQDPYGSLNPRISVGDALGEALSVHRIVPRERSPPASARCSTSCTCRATPPRATRTNSRAASASASASPARSPSSRP